MADERKEREVGPEILDLDALAPRPRLIKLAGKELDVTELSIENAILLADFAETQADVEGSDALRNGVALIAKLVGETPEWIQEKCTMTKIRRMVRFISNAAEAALEEADEGNA